MKHTKWLSGTLATAMLLTLPLATPIRAAEGQPTGSTGTIYSDASVCKAGEKMYTTQHEATFKVQPGDKLDVRTTVDAKVVREQIKDATDQMKKKYPMLNESFYPSIKLSDLEYEMKLVIHWNSDLEIPDPSTPEGKAAYRFEPDTFEVKFVEKSGSDLTVKMGLKNEEKYTNFDVLWKAIHEQQPYAVNRLVLSIDGVKVSESAQPGKLQSTAELTGHFSAKATVSFFGRSLSEQFNYNWVSEQDKDIPTDEPGIGDGGGDGTDSELVSKPEDHTTSLTLEIAKGEEPTPPTPTKPIKPNPPAPSVPEKPAYFKPVVPPTKPDPKGNPDKPKKDIVPNTGAHS